MDDLPFPIIPIDCHYLIFRELSGDDLFSLVRVNKYTNKLCNNNFWRERYLELIPIDIRDYVIDETYKQIYYRFYKLNTSYRFLESIKLGYLPIVQENKVLVETQVFDLLGKIEYNLNCKRYPNIKSTIRHIFNRCPCYNKFRIPDVLIKINDFELISEFENTHNFGDLLVSSIENSKESVIKYLIERYDFYNLLNAHHYRIAGCLNLEIHRKLIATKYLVTTHYIIGLLIAKKIDIINDIITSCNMPNFDIQLVYNRYVDKNYLKIVLDYYKDILTDEQSNQLLTRLPGLIQGIPDYLDLLIYLRNKYKIKRATLNALFISFIQFDKINLVKLIVSNGLNLKKIKLIGLIKYCQRGGKLEMKDYLESLNATR